MKAIILLGVMAVVTIQVLWMQNIAHGQDKLDPNNFASVIETFRENDGMLTNLSTSMSYCEGVLQIDYGNKTEYNEYLATCLRYSEALNTMMKTFQNSTKTDMSRILAGLGMGGLEREWNNISGNDDNDVCLGDIGTRCADDMK